MSTSAYYNFITPPKPTNQATHVLAEPHPSSIEAHRLTAVSPSSFTTSFSNSSSSLYQFNSLTPTSSSSSSSSSSASSSSSTSFSRNHRDFLRQTSVTPTQTHHHNYLTGHQHHTSQLFHSYTLHSLEPKPLKPFKNKSDYLEAMKEDLAEWLNRLYSDLDLTQDNFFAQLETGSIICRHANNVTRMGRSSMMEQNARDASINNSQHELSRLNISNVVNNSNGSNIINSRESVDTKNSPPPASNESNYFSSSTNSLHNNTSNNNQQHPTRYSSLSSSFGQNSQSPTQRLDNRNINWFRVKILPYKQDACPGTFFARDNICQFILWCRSLNIRDCLLFETDDLAARKNEKSFILCLLEVARIGFNVGMPTPLIIQLEQEIDREIENDAKRELEEKQNKVSGTKTDSFGENELKSDITNQISEREKGKNEIVLDGAKAEMEQNEREDDEEVEDEKEDTRPKPQVITNDLVSLHEKVVRLLCQCTCPTQFPMVRVGDNGKYKVGDKLIIFVRILRRHIMVRVGGGWQELSEFLRVKDPCRSRLCHQQLNNSHQTITTMAHQLHTKFAPNSRVTVPKSQFNENGCHSNKGHLNNNSTTTNNNTSQLYTTKSFGGQRLISGSASMGWLSHNS